MGCRAAVITGARDAVRMLNADGTERIGMPKGTYTREEIVRRGQALYDEQIRSTVEPDHKGEFLVLDIETGAYEIDADELAALDRAKAKDPDAPLYLLRIGSPAAYKLGGQFQVGRP
jgi:hypothetical protein